MSNAKMSKSVFSKYRYDDLRRRYFLTNKEEIRFSLPPLNEMQVESFSDFFQMGVEPSQRKDIGLQGLFNSTFPFFSNDRKVRLEFSHYTIGEKPYTVRAAIENDKSYVIPIKATIRLILEETGEIKEQEIFIGDFPDMTSSGTFVINGDERVVVSQIHRSPGVVFDYNERMGMYHCRLIPDKGPWLEFEIIRDVLYVRIDRKARTPFTMFLRALGFGKNEEILKLFYEGEELVLKAKKEDNAHLLERRFFKNVLNGKGEVKFRAGSFFQEDALDWFMELPANERKVFLIQEESLERDEVIINTLDKDSEEIKQSEACKLFYFNIRGSQPPSAQAALNEIFVQWECVSCEKIISAYLKPEKCIHCDQSKGDFNRADKSIFFHPSFYSLGSVGRYKINRKFLFQDNLEDLVLTVDDIICAVLHLIKVKNSEEMIDDIDHLGNRRIRSVSEQLINHLKVCFNRMERLAKDRITIQEHNTLVPQSLVSIKPLAQGINEFFGTSQLSQFMDQTNPLSATTHKRRISALGPGGLTRERAGFEVRDIHYTHYGRVCPIETPEGPNIGLIVSLASYARVNQFGFIETPYCKVENRKVTNKVDYLSAIEEERYVITPADNRLNAKGEFEEEMIPVRHRGNYSLKYSKEVDYIDVSSQQSVSISGALIPFLEHDDANRALMGCNMMRQVLPLLKSEAPIVGTGMESVVAAQSGFCQLSESDGKVSFVDNGQIQITRKEGVVDSYKLIKSYKTNQETYLNQRPVVVQGQKVRQGDLLTNGPCVENNELALGKNVLVAFMPWEGFNYEDAILMSERLLKDDAYTSIRIEELEVESRETKLGKEQITRDIPNLAEEEYHDLDESGIVNIGGRVRPGNILVGKITPKSPTEVTPEYRLLHSIFGEKAKDVKDTSLRVSHGTEGIVIGVKRYSRDNNDDLKPGVIEKVKILIAKKRKLKEGDKFAGRHGNKGVVARIIPEEDMPFMEDGTPVDVVLNPLGVPSRMNIGQVMEVVLGMIGRNLKMKFAVPVFEGPKYEVIKDYLKEAKIDSDGKSVLYDGRSGIPFENRVTVGVMYYLKLTHLVDDKIHARSTGPYSLVTQQPLGGKSQFGGQRVGEMEVWAIEAYGAANVLQEFLTVKSDAIKGRTRIYEAIVKGDFVTTPGIPESFNVLIHELRGLGLNIEIFDQNNRELNVSYSKKKMGEKII